MTIANRHPGLLRPGRVLALALPLLWVCSDDDSSYATTVAPAYTLQTQYAAVALRTHALINLHRDSLGLDTLRWSECIARYTRDHSSAMAAGVVAFGHDGFIERGTDIAANCTTHNASAENVARPGRTPADPALAAVTTWLNSSGHKANIEGGYTHTGVGVARSSDSTWYFTQFFIHAQ